MQERQHRQKDPLLIFKLESVKLWDNMIDDMVNRISSVLMRCQIPVVQSPEAAPEQHAQRSHEQKKISEELHNRQLLIKTRAKMPDQIEPHALCLLVPRPNIMSCGSGKKFKTTTEEHLIKSFLSTKSHSLALIDGLFVLIIIPIETSSQPLPIRRLQKNRIK